MALGSVMLAWCFTRTGAKAPPQAVRDVGIGATGGDGIPEDLSAMLADAVRGFVCAPGFDTAQDTQQLGRCNGVNTCTAQPRIDVASQAAFHLLSVRRGPRGAVLGQPFLGHVLEGACVATCGLRLLPNGRRIDACGDQFTRRAAPGAGGL